MIPFLKVAAKYGATGLLFAVLAYVTHRFIIRRDRSRIQDLEEEVAGLESDKEDLRQTVRDLRMELRKQKHRSDIQQLMGEKEDLEDRLEQLQQDG